MSNLFKILKIFNPDSSCLPINRPNIYFPNSCNPETRDKFRLVNINYRLAEDLSSFHIARSERKK